MATEEDIQAVKDEAAAREFVRKHVATEDDGPTRRARLAEEPTEAEAIQIAAERRD